VNISTFIRRIFWCHGIPERCLRFGNGRLPVCARCTGIALGCAFGIPYIIIFPGAISVVSLFLLLPLMIDGSGQLIGLWKSTNARRFLTGLLAGMCVMFFIVFIFQSGYRFGKVMRNKIDGGTKLCFAENAVKK
jgi:uncharacterized membrane protein